ncbi:MAG: hypothetical protein ACJAUP_001004 [Cellvibrionaceae bacterium]|jgi:hypothetical protein
MNNDVSDARPWYRQFWAWFILSPLIAVVIVSSITVTLAVKGADDRVVDNYYKEGRMINMRIDEDVLAQKLGIIAEIQFDVEINELSLRLKQTNSSLPEKLKLEFSHPVQAELDYSLILNRVGANQYQAELSAQPLRYRWYLRLLPLEQAEVDERWRLRGEINFSDTQTVILKADS